MSKEKSPPVSLPRVPPAAAGIQVNHCKNPLCPNFGIPPKSVSAKGRGRPKKGVVHEPVELGDYQISAESKGNPRFNCELCCDNFPMQSNLAIAEELLRISAYLEPPAGPACPNELCEYEGVPLAEAPENYARYGTNSHGSPRYRCNHCRKVFSFAVKSTRGQHDTHVNRDIFEHLVNTVPLRRIIKLLKITPGVLYRRLDFIWKQCQAFSGSRERTLLEKQSLRTMYLSMDRQALMVNWSSRKDRRNTMLWSSATADLDSGFVFAVTINYDASMDAELVLEDMIRYGDDHLTRPFRRYARVWLPQDFDAESAKSVFGYHLRKKPKTQDELIEEAYANALRRGDIEAGDGPYPKMRTPLRGMQVHEQVSMSAHVQFVARLLRNAKKIRLYMDQEAGLRAAFMAAYRDRIQERTADAWYVSVLKEGTVGQKMQLVRLAQERFAQAQIANPLLNDQAVAVLLMREEMARVSVYGPKKDRWVSHPFPDMREPEKKLCWLTDIVPLPQAAAGDDVETVAEKLNDCEDMQNHAARLYLKGALYSVDRFFMQVRRALTMAERGVATGGSSGGVWFGKNAYDPANLVKLLEIFRVYFNYCEVGEDSKTPAMRLGLAKGPVSSEDVLYFSWNQVLV